MCVKTTSMCSACFKTDNCQHGPNGLLSEANWFEESDYINPAGGSMLCKNFKKAATSSIWRVDEEAVVLSRVQQLFIHVELVSV